MAVSSPGATDTTLKIKNPAQLWVGRITWSILFFFSIYTLIVVIPITWEQSRNVGPEVAAGLAQIGLSADAFGAYIVSLQILTTLVYFAVGGFVVWRRSDEQMGLLTAVLLVTFGACVPMGLNASIQSLALTNYLLVRVAFVVGWVSLWIFLAVFPNGQFIPRWSLIFTLIGVTTIGLWMLPADSPLNPFNWFAPLLVLLYLVTFGGLTYAQFYRYRHILTPIQRQQAKWLNLVAAFGLSVESVVLLLPVLFPSLTQPGLPALLYRFAQTLPFVALMLVPVALMFAIVRYRLWDVDFIINRSLVYGAVTLALLLVFGVGTLIVRAIVGESLSGIAFPISAVAVGLLFNPTRKQVQSLVDHRIYHFNYDLNQLSEAQKKPDIKNPGFFTGKMLGQYEVLDVLGKGGMGEVYKGFRAETGETVALKILSKELAVQEAFVSRFDREARVMQRLNHPNIVKLLSVGSAEEVRYLALDYIDGVDLRQYMTQHSPLSVTDAQRILEKLAAALDYAHSLGIVHRDIKPSNVMLRGGNPALVMLMDFGIAKLSESQTRLTGTGAIGTIDYMAPEQVIAASEVDGHADIYALGVLMFEMLTGEPPFKGNVGQIIFAHLQQPPPDPRDLKPDLPRPIAKAVQQAMAKRPEDRFETAGGFAAAVNSSL